MRSKWCLSLEDAKLMVAAAQAEAAKGNFEATIAVCDDSGHLIYLERPDSQRVNSVEMATQKARTAALRARPSSALAKRVETRPGFLKQPNCLPIIGGVPIFYRDICVGGIGVSGISKQDEPVALAGANALPQG
jgi:glc operon protein GlcG